MTTEIKLSEDVIEKLNRFQFLLGEENTSDTLDFIIRAFGSDIEEFISEFLMRVEHEEYINSDKFRELELETERKIKAIQDKQNV